MENVWVLAAVWVGLLSTSHLSICKHRLTQCQRILAFLALVALLTVRFTPPHFGVSSSLHATFECSQTQDKRQCFEYDGLYWAAPTRVFHSVPPSTSSSHLNLSFEFRPQIELDGSYHNRPPPLV